MKDGLRECIESRAQAQCKVQLLYVSCSKSYIIVSVFQSCNLSAVKQNCFQWALGAKPVQLSWQSAGLLSQWSWVRAPRGVFNAARQMRSPRYALQPVPCCSITTIYTFSDHVLCIDMHLSSSCSGYQLFLESQMHDTFNAFYRRLDTRYGRQLPKDLCFIANILNVLPWSCIRLLQVTLRDGL